MFVQSSAEVRGFFVDVMAKLQTQTVLEPIEAMVADVIERHPEYHNLLAERERALDDDYLARHFEFNPFLHMGLHVALQEQLQADRPRGVCASFDKQQTLGRFDRHQIEHRMMDCLSKSLWAAQQAHSSPDEHAYLECLNRLA